MLRECGSLGGCRKKIVKKQWHPKSCNPVSIGDNSQGNGTEGRLLKSQQDWCIFYDTEAQGSQCDILWAFR
jgi:hypothetical protein